MALAFDTHGHTSEDLGHDTLMGLQELDSHLSIFEDITNPGMDAPSAASDPPQSAIQDAIDLNERAQIGDAAEHESQTKPRLAASHVGVDSSRLYVNRSPHSHASVANSAVRIKQEYTGSSLTSSMATDRSDGTPALSMSSKATSPTDLDTSSRDAVHPSRTSVSDPKPRPRYDVRPKVSIPTDVAPQEYARQCIAAAESSRLNPYSLHPEEHSLLRAHLSHSQVTTYLNIRNGILRLWTRNPLIKVLRDEALGCARDVRWFDVANLSYEWLVRRGYINFGCLETTSNKLPLKRSPKRKRKTIAVIGAGMAGLGCARQLEGLFAHFEHRFKEQDEDLPRVIVLEGRDRVGGRVYSRGLESKDSQSKLTPGTRCTAEIGGMIVTGFDRGNPLNTIVRGQLALQYHALRPTTTLYDSNGQPVDQNRDQLAENLYNDVLERVSDYKFRLAQPQSVEGDRISMNAGRDAHPDNARVMKDIEDERAQSREPLTVSASGSMSLPMVPATEVVPVSSDRLTGRAHVEPGIPAIHTAAYKARQMGWALKADVEDSRDLDLAGSASSEDATLGSVMDEAIRQFRNVVHILPLDLRLLNWHIANLEYSNAINYKELSLPGWDVDAGNEWEGKHTMIIGGYQQVPRGLLQCPRPLSVRKRSPVTRILYSSEAATRPAQVECEDGYTVQADCVVSSIPLGVLKRNEVDFQPALPSWKLGAIERLGYGILNKVILVYKEPFWDETRDIFGVLQEPLHRASLDQDDYASVRGRFFQWFNVTKTSGKPALLALMAGDAAFWVENGQDELIVRDATAVLRRVFGPAVPQPVEVLITRWGQDKFARGSYSYTGPKFKANDYEVMAKPIGNLFFTGEHTCGTHPATVHGAYISGLRAASEVLETLIGPISHAQPLLPPKDTPSNFKRKASNISQETKDPKQARLEAYEIEVWNAIYDKLGERPFRPAKVSANPYMLYSKDNYDAARKKCDEGRRPGKARVVPNEVRTMLSKMWAQATDDEKRPFTDRASAQKEIYTRSMAEYNEVASKWDLEALAFRKEYEAQHPSQPGPEERLIDQFKRDRRAKRLSGYAEDSGSDVDG
ncbi:MAG: hypothetical protein M1818_005963 [Claussenomyces sp. TS43310]|nr:MAG: hypothetical protein M1818_005963 [Claussenomyces sp. TS43310]